jgi:hypothetical protein
MSAECVEKATLLVGAEGAEVGSKTRILANRFPFTRIDDAPLSHSPAPQPGIWQAGY